MASLARRGFAEPVAFHKRARLSLLPSTRKRTLWGPFLWRRRRDSNPRDAFDAYTISSRAPSTKLGDFSMIFNCAVRKGQFRISQQMVL